MTLSKKNQKPEPKKYLKGIFLKIMSQECKYQLVEGKTQQITGDRTNILVEGAMKGILSDIFFKNRKLKVVTYRVSINGRPYKFILWPDDSKVLLQT